MNYPKIRGSWYKKAGPKRDYNTLQNYKITTPASTNPRNAEQIQH